MPSSIREDRGEQWVRTKKQTRAAREIRAFSPYPAVFGGNMQQHLSTLKLYLLLEQFIHFSPTDIFVYVGKDTCTGIITVAISRTGSNRFPSPWIHKIWPISVMSYHAALTKNEAGLVMLMEQSLQHILEKGKKKTLNSMPPFEKGKKFYLQTSVLVSGDNISGRRHVHR